MKTQKSIATLIVILTMLSMACQKENVNSDLVLNEVMVPEGYVQNEAAPPDAQARLEELRLDNPKDQYYYLEWQLKDTENWVFPQKELKIEYVAYSDAVANETPEVVGVVVKKISGKWDKEDFTYIDHKPLPKDGLQGLYKYIQSNLKYPEAAKEAGVEGKVFVEFIVDKDGSLTDIKTVKGIGHGCDDEAERVLKASPAWNPGMIADQPVRVKMILPIMYKLG